MLTHQHAKHSRAETKSESHAPPQGPGQARVCPWGALTLAPFTPRRWAGTGTPECCCRDRHSLSGKAWALSLAAPLLGLSLLRV